MSKVIYILSVGHSGSTLLDIMLGQFTNTFSTGELKHLIWQLYREVKGIEDEQSVCTCGKKFSSCNIWSNVLLQLANEKNTSIDRLYTKFGLKYFEHINYFKRPIYFKILRKLYYYNLIPSSIIGNILNKQTADNVLLYESISKYTGAEYIIDSSKDVIRYNELQQSLGKRIFPIILIRNVADITLSDHLKNNSSAQLKKTWIEYYNNKVLPLLESLNSEDFEILSYEEFIENPQKVIHRLSKKINIDSGRFDEKVTMDDMHLCAGNPIRYQKEIKIRKKELDEKYIEQLRLNGLHPFFIENLKQS